MFSEFKLLTLNIFFLDEQALNSSTELEGEASGEASGEGSGLGGNMTAETHAEDSDDSLWSSPQSSPRHLLSEIFTCIILDRSVPLNHWWSVKAIEHSEPNTIRNSKFVFEFFGFYSKAIYLSYCNLFFNGTIVATKYFCVKRVTSRCRS